jgi:hypothetical protein
MTEIGACGRCYSFFLPPLEVLSILFTLLFLKRMKRNEKPENY